jgi:hypothetical protein
MARWPVQVYSPHGSPAHATDIDLTNEANWQPDGQCCKCNGCGFTFTFSKRRHHCRGCLWIFCDDCSSRRAVLPKVHRSHEQRVCDRCFAQATIGACAHVSAVQAWTTLENPVACSPAAAPCRYPIDPLLNAKISLWVGEAWRLAVDAVAIESPKKFSSVSTQPAALEPFDTFNFLAGRQFTEELRFLDDCRVGDVKVVRGYHLPCSNVLLVGCPYFRRSHESASLSGLHQCYRRSIEFAIDCSASTLGIRSASALLPQCESPVCELSHTLQLPGPPSQAVEGQ